jgi:hypothetical protein
MRGGGGGGMRGGGGEGMRGGGGGGMRGGGGGGMRGGGGRGGPSAPTSKSQLVGLVAKLDILTAKPLVVNLTEEQKRQIREKLQGLSEKKDLSEEDAKSTLDAILEIIKNDKETLAAAGYPPGQSVESPPAIPNPFLEGGNAEHLKALQARLAPKGTQ